MRNRIVVRGLILLLVGTLFMTLGVLTGRLETKQTSEDILNGSYSYDFLDRHQYTSTANLLPGTYELHYQFFSDTAIVQFYVRVLDPDGLEINAVYGPPTVYQNQSTVLSVETQATGSHSFIFGGQWVSVQFSLVKVAQVTQMVYPLEIVIYLGLIFLTAGVIASISGAVLEEKQEAHWFDNL